MKRRVDDDFTMEERNNQKLRRQRQVSIKKSKKASLNLTDKFDDGKAKKHRRQLIDFDDEDDTWYD